MGISDDSVSRLEKAIAGLTKPVWFIAIILTAHFALSIFPWIYPTFYVQRFSEANMKGFSSETFSTEERDLTDAPTIPNARVLFHELSMEEQLKQATAIVYAKFRPSDDGRFLAIVEEYLKSSATVKKQFKIGDEYSPSSYYPKEKYLRGDGVILFFSGSSANASMSNSVYDSRVPGFGDITIEMLKIKIDALE